MYALMYYQTAIMTEHLIANITNIRALTTMYALMYYQITILPERLITHYTGIRTLITMDAFMCYQTPLMSESSITHVTQIWTLTPIDITGMSAFSNVYMMFFIQSTLVKTQRLNNRIYFDRKNSYFYSVVYIKKKPLRLKNCDICKCVLDDFKFFV